MMDLVSLVLLTVVLLMMAVRKTLGACGEFAGRRKSMKLKAHLDWREGSQRNPRLQR